MNRHKDISFDSDDIVSEKWDSTFTPGDGKRFEEVRGEGYECGHIRRGYRLRIVKPHCFAWADNTRYRYNDFLLECEIEFDKANGHSAAGFLFRKTGNEHYYYFLVSDDGHFRLDLVRNEEPSVLVGWTPCSKPADRSVFLRIIARGNTFVFMVNEAWVASFSDDTLGAGRIAFGGQNYGDREQAAFILRQLRINSVPIDVETGYIRWGERIPPAPEARIHLARTLFSREQYAMAAVQLKKAFMGTEADADGFFLLGECCIKLGMYPEALAAMDKALQRDPAHEDARLEKGNILYLTNHFLDLKGYMKTLIQSSPEKSLVWNLLGHAEYNLGNWQEAADAYGKAASLEPEMPLYLVNCARSLAHMGKRDEALNNYLHAATLFFRQEAYMDLDSIIPVIDRLDNANPLVRAVHGKMAFHRGEYAEAGRIFSKILGEGIQDSSVCFLYGLCHILEGKRDLATEYLFRATEMEPDYYLYWFRLAENLYLLDLDCHDEIMKALELSPREPWVLNLAGLVAMKVGDMEKACTYLEEAFGIAPDETDIGINLSQVYTRSGEYDRAREILDRYERDSRILNQYGNILVEEKRFEDAVAVYEEALRAGPEDADVLFNCGCACLELNQVIRAEELFARAMEEYPGPHMFLKLSETARLKGEYYRAEAIMEEATGIFQDDPVLWKEYLSLLHIRNRGEKAEELLQGLQDRFARPDIYDGLKDYLYKRYYSAYRCSDCGRTWHVPRSVREREGVDVHGEPPDSLPAGKCSSCGNVYCIGCARARLSGNRFLCLECGQPLKIADAWIAYLLED